MNNNNNFPNISLDDYVKNKGGEVYNYSFRNYPLKNEEEFSKEWVRHIESIERVFMVGSMPYAILPMSLYRDLSVSGIHLG